MEAEIPKDLLPSVCYSLHFASTKLYKFYVNPDELDKIQVWISSPEDLPEVTNKINLSIRSLLDKIWQGRLGEKKRIFSHAAERTTQATNLADHLASRDELVNFGLGDIGVGPTIHAVMEFFDKRFLEIAARFGAVTYSYPSLLPVSFLEKIHYFDSFSPQVFFANHLIQDIDLSVKFMAHSAKNDGVIPHDASFYEKVKYALSPAVCFQVYRSLENRTLNLKVPFVVTALGKCFRFESTNAYMLERLWEFAMREIVFIGTRRQVEEMRSQSIDEAKKLIQELDMESWIEESNDSFFFQQGDKRLKAFNLPDVTKYELRMETPGQRSALATASFNLHGNFFSKSLQISSLGGIEVWSGCAAFGLERWAWALLSQFGVDPDKWPNTLAKAVGIS